MADELLDLKDSKLLLEGTKAEQKEWSDKIAQRNEVLRKDRNERVQVYTRRHDFFTGNQGDYSNIVGIIKDVKQKKGHTSQITNYAGKTVVKSSFGLANNPPKMNVPPLDINDPVENVKAQAVESFLDSVFDSRINKFWKKTYRRSCFIQSEYGDVAVKVCPTGDKDIRLVNHDDMATISVGWNGNPGEFDYVVVELLLTPQAVFDQYGIKVNEKALGTNQETTQSGASWQDGNEWGTKASGKNGQSILPTGKTSQVRVKVLEYDDAGVYAIKIEGELVQLVFKDDETFPKIKFWTIIPNIPNPPSPWSIADIDYMMDLQIELNDNDNRTADHLRIGNVQRYVAYNVPDLDPESIKTSSGQVIFINDPDGKSRFEPLPTNINNFPDDQYHQRIMGRIYDMGLPKVNYGSSTSDSGRSKAVDYQSSIDLVQFKRDAWELALQEISEKIQILGNFFHPELDWFSNSTGEFVVRNVEFDWTDILPVSQSDKIVNIANKFNMIGLSLKQAYKELGYRNPDALLEELKNELDDPKLMILRAKAWDLSQGILTANMQAATMGQSLNGEVPGNPNQSSPTLTTGQNSESSQPMASKGGTTAFSSMQGMVAKERQNTQARGK